MKPVTAEAVPWGNARKRVAGAGWGRAALLALAAGLYVLLLFAVGVAAGLGALIPLAFFALGVVALMALANPRFALWFTIISGLVAIGTLKLYYPPLQILRWVIPLLGAGVLVSCWAQYAFGGRQPNAPVSSPLLWWLLAFAAYGVAVTVVNWQGLGATFMGMKNYFQIWSLILAFAFISVDRDGVSMRRVLGKVLVIIALLQLPLVAHQYLVIVPARAALGGGLSPEDVVAGTFGAEYYGGGNNALLAAYLFGVIGYVVARWQGGLQKGATTFLLIAALAIPVFLNEAKVSLVYAWIVFLVLFWQDLRRRPVRFVLGHIVLLLFLVLFVETYAQMAASSGKSYGLVDYLDHLFEQNVNRGYGSLELNRFSSLTFWAGEHFPRDVVGAVFGHGLSQSADGSGILEFGSSLAGTRYQGMGIGLTALSSLLWDVGLVGVLIVFAIFVSAYRLAARLAVLNAENKPDNALFRGLQVSIAVMGFSLLHKNFFVFEIVFQVWFALVMGFLVFSSRLSAERAQRASSFRT